MSNVPQAPDFLKSLLSTPIGSLPKVPIWAIDFGTIPIELIENVEEYQTRLISPKPNSALLAKLASGPLQSARGCLFAQAVALPGDGFQSNAEGTQQGGVYREYMNMGRDDPGKIKISFLDTVISFTENIIRPWVTVVSHLGMVARGPGLQYRTDMNVYRWSTGTKGGEPFIYQKWTFFGACPINVSTENIEYTPQSGVIRRDVDFVYQYYTSYPTPEANLNLFVNNGS